MQTFENFKIDVDADGIATIAFDVPGRSMNTLTSSVMAELPQLAELIKTDETIKGAVITSGKASGFCAGADLGDMAAGLLSGSGDLQKAFDAGWKMNVNGGGISMGHPLGATGAMITGIALDELERSNKSTALVTLCIGGGMGTATVIERV